MKVKWTPAPGTAEQTIKALREEGVEVRPPVGIEPVSAIIVGVTGATTLIRIIINLYRDAKYKGVIVDATQSPILIREMPGWPRQQTLVITDDAVQMFPAKEMSDVSGLENIAAMLKERFAAR